MTREIEERGDVEEVRGGRREGVVPPRTRRARGPRVMPRGAELRMQAIHAIGAPVQLRVDGGRPPRPREMSPWFALDGLRRALGRERGVRWRTIPVPPLAAWADATWIETSLVADRLSGWRPSLTPLLLRALAAGLRAFPRANACFGADSAHAPLCRQVHLGVALYTARGLRIPVLRHADRKSARELERELLDLARRARTQASTVDEDRSATFCDLGALGRDDLPAHLAATEGLVLGVGAVHGTARRVHGRLEIRRMLPLTLAVGRGGPERAEGARLLRWLVRAIEDPRLLAFAR